MTDTMDAREEYAHYRLLSKTANGMNEMIKQWGGQLHGDFLDEKGRLAWDIQFPSVFDATSWVLKHAGYFLNADLRDMVGSLHDSCTVTAVCR